MSSACPFSTATEASNRADPYPFFAQMPGGPVRLEDGRFVVSGYHSVQALLHDPRLSSAGKNDGEERGSSKRVDLLKLDPPNHDRIRRIMMRQFGPPHRPRLVSDLESAITSTAHDLIDALEGTPQADLVGAFAHPLPLTIIRRILDIPRSDEARFRDWVAAVTDATGISERSPEASEAFRELSSYLAEIARGRRGKSGGDLLTGLVNDEGPEGKLPETSIGPMAALLLIAGHETTVNLIANGILTLLRHPDEITSMRSDPRRAIRVVEELLRYEPPVQFITNRTTLSDVEVEGITLPAGSTVVLVLAAANRDPTRFDRAGQFDPDRIDNQHLGFGSGVHSCFGAAVARLEGQVALNLIFRRLVAPKLVEAPPYRTSPALRGPSKLMIAYDGIRARSRA